MGGWAKRWGQKNTLVIQVYTQTAFHTLMWGKFMFCRVLTYIICNCLPFLCSRGEEFCSKGRVFHLKQGPECRRWKGGTQAS